MDHVQTAKEVVRHLMFKIGGVNALRFYKRLRGLKDQHLSGVTVEDRFSTIYRDSVWATKDQSLSGPGSTVGATNQITENLSAVLKKLGARQVTDIGCGDFGWMRRIQGDFQYCGVDIVKSLIDELIIEFSASDRRFLHLNAIVDPLPPGDVAICWEVLFHLSFCDALSVIKNVQTHGYQYLIATTDFEVWFNADISSGDHRPLNLLRPPFKFPAPVEVLKDDRVANERVLAVWPVEDLPV